MLQLLTNFRPYLEALYFASGVVLTVGLLVAWAQLAAFRRDAVVRNERLAKEKAVEACSRYLTTYVGLSKVFFKDRTCAKLPSYNGEIGDFSSRSLSPRQTADAAARGMCESCLPALNELELISSTFITGVADERTGFQIIGRSFCATVRHMYDIIAILRGEDRAQPYWFNIVALYNLWEPRLATGELESQAEELHRKINALPRDRTIKPVGS